MDCSPPGSSVHRIFQAEHWSRLPFPTPGDLPYSYDFKKWLLIIIAIYEFITEENLRSLFFTFVNDISLPITTLIAFMITQTLPYWLLSLIIWYFSILHNLILLYHLCPLCLPYLLAKTDVKLNVFKYNLHRKTSMKKYRLLCPWNSPGKNTGMDCHSLLQGIFRTQESNPDLLHCRQILYHLNHQRSSLWQSWP